MVMPIRKILPITVVALCVYIFFFSVSSAQVLSKFQVEKQWVKIWINKDGTIDLLYNLTLVCNYDRIRWITIGQPNEHFSVTSCEDLENHVLDCNEIKNGWSGVNITLHEPIFGGEEVTVLLLTRVDRMIWKDETNPGNVCMMFTPCWWPDCWVEDLRIAVVLPEGVKENETLHGENRWANLFQDPLEGGKLVAYWNQSNLPPDAKYPIAASFPKEYVEKYYSESPWDRIGGLIGSLLGPVFAISIIAIFAIVIFRNFRRFPYSMPSFSMEALGVRKGLTAVEAATLLDVDPRRILTMILFGLMRKGAVNIVETKPKLRLQVVSTAGLRYYEDWFVDSIVFQSRVGTLSDGELSRLILKLRGEVNRLVRYYCRADTIKYYEKTVEDAWKQVQQAGTPEVKAEVFNEELEWLMMAPRFRRRVERAFRRGEEIPLQSSWWLPYWSSHYAPSGFRGADGKPVSVQSLPGVQFAHAAVTSIESTVGRIVTNVEAFSKSLIPVTPLVEARASSPVSRGGCVCACASCACACACASCACACASGGAG